MKKIGEYTVRGSFDDAASQEEPIRVQLDDGRFDTGYRIVKFEATITNPTVNEEFRVLVQTQPNLSTDFDFGINTQIAWAWGGNNNTTSASFSNFSIIDPDNLVIQDLYLIAQNAGSGQINYIMTMEKYEFSDWRGALGMVRNKSQG